MKRIAINGFGRIGRAFFRLAYVAHDMDVVAVNDLAPAENLAYLLKYDSAQGGSGFDVKTGDGEIIVNGEIVKFYSERDPAKLPWGELAVDIVVESSGVFTNYDDAGKHLEAGAKRVVISAPAKGKPKKGVSGTALVGVNEATINTCKITSNASCTTNATAPVVTILDEAIGIEKAILNTIHGYTASQPLVDSTHKKDYRRGRAGAVNIVPTTTGAAVATTLAYPPLKGKFDGMAVRVPVVSGSITDLVFVSKKKVTVEEINEVLEKASKTDRWKKTFAVTREPLVSSDIIGKRYASIADLNLTQVIDGNLVRVMAWYDNEMGYVQSLLEHVRRIAV